jgi:nucleolar protein 12
VGGRSRSLSLSEHSTQDQITQPVIRRKLRTHDGPGLTTSPESRLKRRRVGGSTSIELTRPVIATARTVDEDIEEISSSGGTSGGTGGEAWKTSAGDDASVDLAEERATRTIFLGNIAVEALTSRAARKALLQHICSGLDSSPPSLQRLESLRFRSIPFSTASLPKRAAYITKSFMSATTKSCNAYAVFSSVAAAQQAVALLNGTVILNRHLRADHVASPAAIDHRRCVFVGNLHFVDDEVEGTGAAGVDNRTGEHRLHRGRPSRDVEEGLWTIFAAGAGRVESVRVVRDEATRVGKGFAYVQFYVSTASMRRLVSPGLAAPIAHTVF